MKESKKIELKNKKDQVYDSITYFSYDMFLIKLRIYCAFLIENRSIIKKMDSDKINDLNYHIKLISDFFHGKIEKKYLVQKMLNKKIPFIKVKYNFTFFDIKIKNPKVLVKQEQADKILLKDKDKKNKTLNTKSNFLTFDPKNVIETFKFSKNIALPINTFFDLKNNLYIGSTYEFLVIPNIIKEYMKDDFNLSDIKKTFFPSEIKKTLIDSFRLDIPKDDKKINFEESNNLIYIMRNLENEIKNKKINFLDIKEYNLLQFKYKNLNDFIDSEKRNLIKGYPFSSKDIILMAFERVNLNYATKNRLIKLTYSIDDVDLNIIRKVILMDKKEENLNLSEFVDLNTLINNFKNIIDKKSENWITNLIKKMDEVQKMFFNEGGRNSINILLPQQKIYEFNQLSAKGDIMFNFLEIDRYANQNLFKNIYFDYFCYLYILKEKTFNFILKNIYLWKISEPFYVKKQNIIENLFLDYKLAEESKFYFQKFIKIHENPPLYNKKADLYWKIFYHIDTYLLWKHDLNKLTKDFIKKLDLKKSYIITLKDIDKKPELSLLVELKDGTNKNNFNITTFWHLLNNKNKYSHIKSNLNSKYSFKNLRDKLETKEKLFNDEIKFINKNLIKNNNIINIIQEQIYSLFDPKSLNRIHFINDKNFLENEFIHFIKYIEELILVFSKKINSEKFEIINNEFKNGDDSLRNIVSVFIELYDYENKYKILEKILELSSKNERDWGKRFINLYRNYFTKKQFTEKNVLQFLEDYLKT